MSLHNIYGDRILFDDFPYNDFHKEVMMFKSSLLFEFESYSLLFYLDNSNVEYSLEILLLPKNELNVVFVPNKNNLINNEFIENLRNVSVLDRKYLHLVDGKEIVEDSFKEDGVYNGSRIGEVFFFDNGNELYVYSGEPDEFGDDNSEYKIFRPDSVICLIFIDKKVRELQLVGSSPFSRYYKHIKSRR